MTQPPILGDDAAIGLRYAERIANGHGFTYNDHERVCGASNPLWTLLISLGPRVGLDDETTTRSLDRGVLRVGRQVPARGVPTRRG